MEFIFSMFLLLIMIFSLARVFLWAGIDVGNRQRAHEASLTQSIDVDYHLSCANWVYYPGGDFCICVELGPPTNGPMLQIDPFFYYPSKLKAYWEG